MVVAVVFLQRLSGGIRAIAGRLCLGRWIRRPSLVPYGPRMQINGRGASAKPLLFYRAWS
jgi:hypothetical protein